MNIFFWLLMLAAFAEIAKGTMDMIQSPSCMKCGGKGKHKDDCPWDRQ